MVERHKKFGIYYVGRTRAYDPFFVYLNKKVEKPEDLAGLKIGRSAPTCVPLFKSLGATVVTVSAGEFYSALERGVIDGAGHPSDGITGLSLPEVAKYLLNEPIFIRNSTVFLMNLKRFDSLSPKIQKIINDTTIAWEIERIGIDQKRVTETLALGKKKGLEFRNFSPEDSKRFFDLAYQTEWENEKINRVPEAYPTLKELLEQ